MPLFASCCRSCPVWRRARRSSTASATASWTIGSSPHAPIASAFRPWPARSSPIGSTGEYQERVLEPMYRDLEPHDPEGVWRHESLNARGAIARLERSSVEIRVLDMQETPKMDVAYAALIVEVLKLLCAEQWLD